MAAAATAPPPPPLGRTCRISATASHSVALKDARCFFSPSTDGAAQRWARRGRGVRSRTRGDVVEPQQQQQQRKVLLLLGSSGLRRVSGLSRCGVVLAVLRSSFRPLCYPRAGLEFPGGTIGGGRGRGRRDAGAPRAAFVAAAAVAMGGKFGSSDRKVAEALEESVLHKILTSILRIVEAQRRRRPWWTSRHWTAAATLTAAAIVTASLASRYLPRGAAMAMVAARFGILGAAAFLVIVPLLGAEKRRLVRENFQQNYSKTKDNLQILNSRIWQTAHNSVQGAAAALSSGSSDPMDTRRKGHSEDENSSTSEGQFRGIARATNANSGPEDLVEVCRPDAESVVTEISQSVAQLMDIMSAAEVIAADEASLIGTKAGIEDLCRQLRCAEAALRAKEELHRPDPSRIADSGSISSPESFPDRADSNPNKQTGTQSLPKSVSSGEPPISSSFLGMQPSPDAQTGRKEQSSEGRTPLTSRTPSTTASATCGELDTRDVYGESMSSERLERTAIRPASGQEALGTSSMLSGTGFAAAVAEYDGEAVLGTDLDVVDDVRPSQVLKSVVHEPVSEMGRLKTSQDHDPLTGGRQYASFTDTLTKAEKSLPGDDEDFLRAGTIQRRRSSSPDPWHTAAERPNEQELMVSSEWAPTARVGWKDGSDDRLVEAILVVESSADAEARNDGIGSNKRVRSSSGSVDFWGKHAGSIMTKTGEQRGLLTKSRASGRVGTGFGSPDEWENDGLQDQGTRSSSEADRRQRLRSEMTSTSGAGQPADEDQWMGPSGRRAARDDLRPKWRDDDSVNIEGRQMVRRDRSSDVRDERLTDLRSGSYPDERPEWVSSTGGNASPQRRSDAPFKTQERRDGSLQAGDEDSYAGMSIKSIKKEDSRGSNRTWNPNGKIYTDDGEPQNGKYSSEYSESHAQELERGVALQKSKEAQSLQFDRYLDQAEALLEEGMQGLEGKVEVGVAERMLYEAAKVLEAASAMDPSNLAAVGQWGNVLLVHGELKLKVSQQIRSMLPSSKPTFAITNWGGTADEEEAMELTLQEVCEECEELLVDAGRKYRRALSLDKSDMRALYNWGLALCYRGQLIADDGGETAMLDADKVYLAAIDKFEAMLGIGSKYSAGALLNWGLALRDRSRLRAMGDKERVQLLIQAKSLFEDAVRLDPKYGQARGAVAACLAELKELQSFKSLQIQEEDSRPKKPSRSWWQASGDR